MSYAWDLSFDIRTELLSSGERTLLSYRRAQALIRTSNLSLQDIESCSQAFMNMHQHPIMALDVGCTNIIACHINLFLGTLALLVPERTDLLPLIELGLRGEIIGNFLLSEIGHGLDIMALETVAEKVVDGYILHTPTDSAAKFMPPTTPHPDIPKFAIVFARLLVNNEEQGIHPFLVPTSTPGRMYPGVTSTLLPPRVGTCPLDYALTSFNRVKLPLEAYLGGDLSRSLDYHTSLKKYIGRLTVGQIAVPLVALTGAKMTSCIGVDYSLRRHIRGTADTTRPIISFRTQQLPVLHCLSVSHVLDAWCKDVGDTLKSAKPEDHVLQGIAVVFKTTVLRLAIQCYREVAERLGAQGTFAYNFVNQIEMDMRGLIIAEGDVTALCIRLYSELLQEKYELPPCAHEDTPLGQHAKGLFAHYKTLLHSLPLGHRDPGFNDLILPQCERGVLSLGCSYAFSSALHHAVPHPLLALFECVATRLDPAWYMEKMGISEQKRITQEDRAVHDALPHIREYVCDFGIRNYIQAPIVSDLAWTTWLENWTKSTQNVADNSGTGSITSASCYAKL